MDITQERLHELFDYNGDSSFTRIVSTAGRARVGQTVKGALDNKGYRRTRVDGKQYKHHRLVWIYHNGKIPEGMQVDHINRIRDDNRIENLQLLNHKYHIRKDRAGRAKSRNKSGIANVFWNKQNQAWSVHFSIDGKLKYFGSFKSKRLAWKRRNQIAARYDLPIVDWPHKELTVANPA